MSNPVVNSVLQGNIEALDQGIQLVQLLTDEQYCHVATPYVSSNIGQHFRHLVDLFFSVVNGVKYGEINYDFRRRGAEIEHSREAALAELQEIREWMHRLKGQPESSMTAFGKVKVISEVTLSDTHSVEMESSLVRELVFASSHAVHHFAIINIVAKMQGVKTNENLGIAPATATFIRDQHEPQPLEA